MDTKFDPTVIHWTGLGCPRPALSQEERVKNDLSQGVRGGFILFLYLAVFGQGSAVVGPFIWMVIL